MSQTRFYFGLFCLFLFVWLLSYQVQEYMLEDDPVLGVLKELLKDVHPAIAKLRLYKGDKSYTLNKQKVFLCIKDENDSYYSLNMLIYVLLHETAHVLNDEIGHGEKFQQIFDSLLEKAKEQGVYNDNIPIVKNYCP